MVQKVIEIEGIGPKGAGALADAGVKSTADLLREGASPAGRKRLAEKVGVTPARVLEWVNRADLMRIKGIGSEYSDLLEASGVDSVKELAHRLPGNLLAKMTEVNAGKKLVRRVPNLSDVEAWTTEAKALQAAVQE